MNWGQRDTEMEMGGGKYIWGTKNPRTGYAQQHQGVDFDGVFAPYIICMAWNAKLDKELIALSFMRSKLEHVYKKSNSKSFLIVGMYMLSKEGDEVVDKLHIKILDHAYAVGVELVGMGEDIHFGWSDHLDFIKNIITLSSMKHLALVKLLMDNILTTSFSTYKFLHIFEMVVGFVYVFGLLLDYVFD
ncbi:hypothetical protein ACJX0J_016736, partial [Zea mays]